MGVCSCIFCLIFASMFIVYANPLISVLPRFFIGITAYWTYFGLSKLFRKAKHKFLREILPASLAGLLGSLTNTILYLLAVNIWTGNAMGAFTQLIEVAVTIYFPIELVACIVLVPIYTTVLKKVNNKFIYKKQKIEVLLGARHCKKRTGLKMIICLDIGNTNIKYGLFDKDKLVLSCRVATDHKKTSDEYGGQLLSILKNNSVTADDIEGGIISSVVPSLDYTLERMCRIYLNIKPLMLEPGLKTGLNLKVDNAKEVGADRVLNNVAALLKYKAPLIIVDFGTATTFNVINSKNEFIGGVISPGIKGSLDSLVNGTAKLPRVEIEKPDKVIGKNTVTNMQSGIFYGFAGLVEYIIKRIKRELKCDNVTTVATGGFAEIIADEISEIDHVDKLLTLNGLKYLYDLNTNGN